jgi:hypothetical protein
MSSQPSFLPRRGKEMSGIVKVEVGRFDYDVVGEFRF